MPVIEASRRPCIQDIPNLPAAGFNAGFARAVLDSLVDGRLWLDCLSKPRAGHVLHPYGMSLVWGAGVDAVVDAVATHLRVGAYRSRDEWLQIDPRWDHLDWDGLLQARPGAAACSTVERFHRLNFRFDRATFLARHDRAQVPAGCRLRPMATTEFDIPGASVVPRAFWRDAPQFLAHGGGWCLEQEGQVAAIAFASYRFDDELEIGVETQPAHRGKGYALAAAVAMIRAILAGGLTPVWSCRQENVASVRMAQRLGFIVTRIGPYFRLPANPPA